MERNSLLAEELLAFPKGLCSLELVTDSFFIYFLFILLFAHELIN